MPSPPPPSRKNFQPTIPHCLSLRRDRRCTFRPADPGARVPLCHRPRGHAAPLRRARQPTHVMAGAHQKQPDHFWDRLDIPNSLPARPGFLPALLSSNSDGCGSGGGFCVGVPKTTNQASATQFLRVHPPPTCLKGSWFLCSAGRCSSPTHTRLGLHRIPGTEKLVKVSISQGFLF